MLDCRVLGTVHISFIAAALYHYLVQNFENPLAPLFSFWYGSLARLATS
jgi:hypothetical protein